jgi:hypothetical protein
MRHYEKPPNVCIWLPCSRPSLLKLCAVLPYNQAGVRPGQRLLSISDPMNSGMWDLNDRPSVRFVRDALAMRSSDSIDLVLSRQSLYEPDATTQLQISIDESNTGAFTDEHVLADAHSTVR